MRLRHLFTAHSKINDLEAGTYVALLSHSGSRGTGAAGLDEVPMAYKNIREVMAAQQDLVTVLGEFMPKLVKMAPAGERPED
jgi:RNA-splicing ligase RtcB